MAVCHSIALSHSGCGKGKLEQINEKQKADTAKRMANLANAMQSNLLASNLLAPSPCPVDTQRPTWSGVQQLTVFGGG